MKKYEVSVRLKKPFTLVDEFPKYPSRDNVLEIFIDALKCGDLDDLVEVKVEEVI